VIVSEIVQSLGLTVAAGNPGLNRTVTGGYSADLLSCVLARAKTGNVWVTLQSHVNVIAIAALLDLAAVIITEGTPIAEDVLRQANSKGVVLLSTPHPTFQIVGELVRLSINATE
jgi:predicted transcriptional regulator